jgi:ferredoxin
MEEIAERKIAGLTVRIKRDTCVATGNCIKLAGDTFEFDDERVCTFRPDSDKAEIDRERLIEACSVCPVDALVALDDEGRQLVP